MTGISRVNVWTCLWFPLSARRHPIVELNDEEFVASTREATHPGPLFVLFVSTGLAGNGSTAAET
jgi:hypothetical protein